MDFPCVFHPDASAYAYTGAALDAVMISIDGAEVRRWPVSGGRSFMYAPEMGVFQVQIVLRGAPPMAWQPGASAALNMGDSLCVKIDITVEEF